MVFLNFLTLFPAFGAEILNLGLAVFRMNKVTH
jgi:hypothetical protein